MSIRIFTGLMAFFAQLQAFFQDYKNALICEQLPDIRRLSDNFQ